MDQFGAGQRPFLLQLAWFRSRRRTGDRRQLPGLPVAEPGEDGPAPGAVDERSGPRSERIVPAVEAGDGGDGVAGRPAAPPTPPGGGPALPSPPLSRCRCSAT